MKNSNPATRFEVLQKNIVEGGVHQAGQPIVVAGRTTAVQSSPKTRREAPHVEAVSLERTLVWMVSLDLMCSRWVCQLSFLSV